MALKNLTPLKMRCGLGTCPGVFEEEDGAHLQIIGKIVDKSDVASQVGSDEALIRVRKTLLENIGGPISRRLMRLGL
jgi:hypothetical protein